MTDLSSITPAAAASEFSCGMPIIRRLDHMIITTLPSSLHYMTVGKTASLFPARQHSIISPTFPSNITVGSKFSLCQFTHNNNLRVLDPPPCCAPLLCVACEFLCPSLKTLKQSQTTLPTFTLQWVSETPSFHPKIC